MLSRTVGGWLQCALALLAAFSLTSCEKVPLLAPTGSTITLTASTNVLSANGTLTIIAQVLESAGTPPHSGTRVTFTTSLGRLEPAEASTDVGGRVTVTFVAGGANGTATISAVSGGATTGTNGALRIAIGSAAVGSVSMDANPGVLPATGGATTLTALVLDTNGNPLALTPVVFSTTAGNLSNSVVNADNNGRATTILTTFQEATVTARVGVQGTGGTGGTGGTTTPTTGPQTAQYIVKLGGAPQISITPPSTQPTKGLRTTFTFVVTAATSNPSPIASVDVDWGDGRSQRLGNNTGSLPVDHVYNSDGTFTINAVVRDVQGNSGSASTSVVVVDSIDPSIVIVQPSSPPVAGLSAAFTFRISVAAGASPVSSAFVDWGDGSSQPLGTSGEQTSNHVYANEGNYTIRATATDIAGNTGSATSTVTVVPVPIPTVLVTPSQPNPTTRRVVAAIQVTMPTGIAVQRTTIDWGDGVVQNLGAATSASPDHTYATAGTKSIRVTVRDSLGRDTIGDNSITLP